MAKPGKFRYISTKNLRYSRMLTFKYNVYNRKYFGGMCPDIEVYYEPMKPAGRGKDVKSGYTAINHEGRVMFIAINVKLREFEDFAEAVLLHEMIHTRFPKDKQDHGSVFRNERRRLIVAGAIDDIV